MEPDVLIAEDSRVRVRAGMISLAVAVVLLGAKYQAYLLTGSTAILSDALESIVNVVAAVFGLGGLIFAGRPADRNHPYGHGKIEFFSAAFEGGLIAFAAVVIIYEVVLSLIRGGEVRRLESGLLVVPEFWSVDQAHELAEDLARQVIKEVGVEGELVFHTDPCHRAYCAMCDLEDCLVRREPFRARPLLTLEEAVRPDMP